MDICVFIVIFVLAWLWVIFLYYICNIQLYIMHAIYISAMGLCVVSFDTILYENRINRKTHFTLATGVHSKCCYV